MTYTDQRSQAGALPKVVLKISYLVLAIVFALEYHAIVRIWREMHRMEVTFRKPIWRLSRRETKVVLGSKLPRFNAIDVATGHEFDPASFRDQSNILVFCRLGDLMKWRVGSSLELVIRNFIDRVEGKVYIMLLRDEADPAGDLAALRDFGRRCGEPTEVSVLVFDWRWRMARVPEPFTVELDRDGRVRRVGAFLKVGERRVQGVAHA